MCRFIETIRAENAVLQQLDRHQQRMSDTLLDHQARDLPSIEDMLKDRKPPTTGRVRIRIEYGTNGHFLVEHFPYVRQQFKKIHLAHTIPPDYRYKYADRAWIDALKAKSGADEIFIVHKGRITDASIANIAFFDGRSWWTPDTPLLNGTERRRLVELQKIREAPIYVRDLGSFCQFRLMNAMLPWEDEVSYDMALVNIQTP